MNRRGLLVANAFLHSDKFNEHYVWLREAAKKRDYILDLYYNDEIISGYADGKMTLYAKCCLDDYDFLLFWDKDIPMGKMLEYMAKKKGISTYNSISAIQTCDDKAETYFQLAKWNDTHSEDKRIPIVDTMVAPMTYSNIGYTENAFLEMVEKKFSYPMIMKECFGSFGWQVYLVHDRKELAEKMKQLAGRPFLFQQYIEKSSGKDVRIQVVGEQVVASMYRYSENGDFRANISSGGVMKKYEPSVKEKQLAVRVTKALGLDFAGVDLLFSNGSKEADVVCEVNSNAHFKNIFTCTNVNVAEKIMDYILESKEKNHRFKN